MWYYNNIRIFVTSIDVGKKQIIARVQPLAGATVLQTFGWDSDQVKLGCIVVGSGDVNAIKALYETGLSYILSGPWGEEGRFYPATVDAKMTMHIYQNLRTDLACDTPTYDVNLELYK